jgi:hypothetical protein
MNDGRLQLDPPLHLVTGEIGCWRCGAVMPVVAILCENAEGPEDIGPYILSNTAELPHVLITFVQRRCPTYRLTYSKTVGGKYYANNCPKCGVISGDFYLHSEPGGPFFPTDQDEASSLTVETIPVTERCFARTGFGYGTGHLILQYAKRNTVTPTSTGEIRDRTNG